MEDLRQEQDEKVDAPFIGDASSFSLNGNQRSIDGSGESTLTLVKTVEEARREEVILRQPDFYELCHFHPEFIPALRSGGIEKLPQLEHWEHQILAWEAMRQGYLAGDSAGIVEIGTGG